MSTSRRLYRIAKVLHQRQPDLMIALDGVHDPHNLSAILRSSDATGIGKVIWQPDRREPHQPNPDVSKGSEKWVSLEEVPNLCTRLKKLKADGFKIAATHLGNHSVDFRSIDWTISWILVMGNEKRGCSKDILEIADVNVILPMMGFVQSLNVSVATAVLLYEIQRQRFAAGMYEKNLPRKSVRKYYDFWRLKDRGIPVEDILKHPGNSEPAADIGYQDGRHVPRKKKQRKNNSI